MNTEKKKEVLDLINKHVCQQTTEVQFGVAKSTVGNINKNRGAIIKAWEETSSNKRKQKLCRTDNENVNACITRQSFLKCGMTIPVIGPMLRTQAREMAQRIHVGIFRQAMEGFNHSGHNTLNLDS